MSTHRTAFAAAALLALSLVAGHAQAASTTMRVGLVLTAPGQSSAQAAQDGVVNAAGAMRVDATQAVALERAIAQAPRVERTSELQADGTRLHSIQF